MLNTRAAEDAGALTARLRQRGGRVIPCPVIRFAPPESWDAFDERLGQLSRDEWIVFTSATALRFVLERLGQLGRQASVLDSARLAVVGPATARALQEAGLRVSLVPGRYQAEGLLAALLEALPPHTRVWLPRAREGRGLLADGLREAGYQVCVTEVYHTLAPDELPAEALAALIGGAVDWLLFTSSSTAANTARLMPPGLMENLASQGTRVACLGASCAASAVEHGFAVTLQPVRQDLDGLVDALCDAARTERIHREHRGQHASQ